jgi:hypothetical protein
MKQPTRKTSILALVGSAGRNKTQAEERTAALKESFDGWLDSVAPNLLESTGLQPEAVKLPRRSLTSIEHIRVNRATVREGVVHRHWPADVVLSFLAAEVIKRNNDH